MKPTPTPPDPEQMNDNRARLAEKALHSFMEGAELAARWAPVTTDQDDAVADLITDLAHWCDRHGMSMARQLRRAIDAYSDETAGAGEQFEGVVTPKIKIKSK